MLCSLSDTDEIRERITKIEQPCGFETIHYVLQIIKPASTTEHTVGKQRASQFVQYLHVSILDSTYKADCHAQSMLTQSRNLTAYLSESELRQESNWQSHCQAVHCTSLHNIPH